MSVPKKASAAKLVVGFFLREKALVVPLVTELSSQFGAVDMVSSWLPFNYTSYYESEMGKPLYRCMVSFRRHIRQETLAEIKIKTNLIENRYSKTGKRRVNIDPGYLLLERFVLATGKNFAHRIYVGNEIYADLTLIYRQGRFTSLPWTFPDYADTPVQDFLEQVRACYRRDLKQATKVTK